MATIIDSTIATLYDADGNPVDASSPKDAFGRVRVSYPTTIFDSKQDNLDYTLNWVYDSTGAASSATHSAANARVQLDPGTDANGYYIRQTRRYFNYQPGKSQLALITFNLNGAATNVTKRVGYFDASNGIYLELTSSGASFNIRSGSTEGNQSVAQTSWNVDKFDGNGPSKATVNWSKAQILAIDFEWLGVGRVRCGLVIDGEIRWGHTFDNANSITYVYMSTPSLPVRYEVRNTGIPSGTRTLDCICCSVLSEGGQDTPGLRRSAFRGAATGNIGSGNSAPLISVRLQSSYIRSTLYPVALSVLSTGSSNYRWVLALSLDSATDLTGEAFGAQTDSIAEVDSTASAVANTIPISVGYSATTTRISVESSLLNVPPLGANVAGTQIGAYVVYITNLSAGNETYHASISWIEVP